MANARDDIGDPAAELWEKRNLDASKTGYMELVYAAYNQGVRDVVIDMAPSMQPGIDEALKIYRDSIGNKTSEATFLSLSNNDVATPMDAVVQQAAQSLDMRVHALNVGLTGIATLFREAQGVTLIPTSGSHQDRIDAYMKQGFAQDKKALEKLLRRAADSFELDVMRFEMTKRLSDDELHLQQKIFDDTETANLIHETVGNKPFLGLFQKARLLGSATDLDGLLRNHYGEKNVARLIAVPSEEKAFPKRPQYILNFHKLKGCLLSPVRSCG